MAQRFASRTSKIKTFRNLRIIEQPGDLQANLMGYPRGTQGGELELVSGRCRS